MALSYDYSSLMLFRFGIVGVVMTTLERVIDKKKNRMVNGVAIGLDLFLHLFILLKCLPPL